MSAPLLFDRALLRKRLHRAAATLPQADFLRRRAAEDLAWRLQGVRRDFPLAVELGARDGTLARALAVSPAAGKVRRLIQTDLGGRNLPAGGVVLDEERLPLRRESVDLVASVLALHWTNDLPGVLAQIRRALKPGGLFLGVMFGGATLAEARRALLEAEADVRGGAGARVAPFADARDGAGLLQRVGFKDPTCDVDVATATYGSPLRLLNDLRLMGETAVLTDRPTAPLTRSILARYAEAYVRDHGRTDGRVPATFEMLTLTGWAPES